MEDRRYSSKDFKQIMDRALRLQGQREQADAPHEITRVVAECSGRVSNHNYRPHLRGVPRTLPGDQPESTETDLAHRR